MMDPEAHHPLVAHEDRLPLEQDSGFCITTPYGRQCSARAAQVVDSLKLFRSFAVSFVAAKVCRTLKGKRASIIVDGASVSSRLGLRRATPSCFGPRMEGT